jgi:parvulin-like peptidyl-prolyl isomerase
LACAAVLLATGVGSVHAASDVVDGVAALVNDDVITFSQVREVVAPRERALRASLSGQELIDKVREARKGALQDLIDRQLILQEFKKKDFQIPQQFIDEHVNTIIHDEFGGDRSAFVRTLQAQGYTMTKFQNAERDKIIVQAMRYSNVKSDFLVSPDKIGSLYNTSKDQFTTPEQVHLWMIAVSKGTPAAGEQDPQRAMAEEIRGKLLKGTKFDQLAQMYSEDSSKQSGGDWGMIDRKTLNETLTNAAFRLPVDKISPIISEGNSYYILKVSEHKDAVTKPLSDVRDDLEKKITSEERQRLQERWIEGLRAKAFIKTF